MKKEPSRPVAAAGVSLPKIFSLPNYNRNRTPKGTKDQANEKEEVDENESITTLQRSLYMRGVNVRERDEDNNDDSTPHAPILNIPPPPYNSTQQTPTLTSSSTPSSSAVASSTSSKATAPTLGSIDFYQTLQTLTSLIQANIQTQIKSSEEVYYFESSVGYNTSSSAHGNNTSGYGSGSGGGRGGEAQILGSNSRPRNHDNLHDGNSHHNDPNHPPHHPSQQNHHQQQSIISGSITGGGGGVFQGWKHYMETRPVPTWVTNPLLVPPTPFNYVTCSSSGFVGLPGSGAGAGAGAGGGGGSGVRVLGTKDSEDKREEERERILEKASRVFKVIAEGDRWWSNSMSDRSRDIGIGIHYAVMEVKKEGGIGGGGNSGSRKKRKADGGSGARKHRKGNASNIAVETINEDDDNDDDDDDSEDSADDDDDDDDDEAEKGSGRKGDRVGKRKR